MLIIDRTSLDIESFRVRGAYSSTIARLFALPFAVESKDPLTLEVTVKGDTFAPYQGSKKVYWNRKYVGFFVLSSVSQEWDGDKYRTRLELKQSGRSEMPDRPIPSYKWRHDLVALERNLEQTDGALIEAGRRIDPFAKSWKLSPTDIENSNSDQVSSAILPVSLGGTGSDDPAIALLNLGGISSISIGQPFGIVPLGADRKISPTYLPAGGGGGGLIFPIPTSQGGTGAIDVVTARANLGAVGFADIPASIPPGAIGTLIAPLDASLKVPIAFLPAYPVIPAPPTLAGLGGIPVSAIGTLIAPLDASLKVPIAFLPAYPVIPAPPTLAGLGGIPASAIGAANGVAPLNGFLKVPIANMPLDSFYAFTGGASFTGGGAGPSNTPSLIQSSVNGGIPRHWLVNSAAPANNRIKSISVANNGNIQIRHHNDDLTDGNVLEHTATGNTLTNGAFRCGSGASNFTGASFVPGAIYYRSDLAMLTYSDGTVWRRMDTNAAV